MTAAADVRPVSGRYRLFLLSILFLLAVVAPLMHGAGHVSMDSSVQLYEAHVGRAISWSPPFMAALMHWLGGGAQATSALVIACSALTYGGLALALSAGAGRREGAASMPAAVGAALIALAVLNPLMFVYVGIVWKDVLFAALLSAAVGALLVAASAAGRPGARAWYGVAAALLLPLLLVRQQGILVAPPLLLACILGLAGPRAGQGWRWGLKAGLALLLCLAAVYGLKGASDATIHSSDDRSTAVGFAAIQFYDLTGMVAGGAARGVVLPGGLDSPAFRQAVERTYSDDRVDFVLNDPAVAAGFASVHNKDVTRAWRDMILDRPDVYARMKARQFGWLLGVYRLDRCLPVHLGVEGNKDYLSAVGIASGMDDRDRSLYELSYWTRHLVLHRHWFYLVLLALCVAWFIRAGKRHASSERVAIAALIAALVLFYASFVVTGLACDFRYLYPGLVGVTTLAVFMLARASLARQVARR